MTPASRRTMAWLLVLMLVNPGFGFAQKKGRLIGKVVDPDGKPIQGVVVTVTSPQVSGFKEVQTTDKKGNFIVDFRQVDVTYHYRFVKEGYQTLEADQEWQLEGTDRFQWTMQPGTAVAAGGQPPVSTSEPAVTAYNAAVAALKTKDYATAATKFTEAVGYDPNLVLGWAALSMVSVQTGHNREAAEAAEKAIALGSREAAVYQARWEAYRNLKDDTRAAEALQDLEKVGRASEEAKKIHNQGVALAKAGDNAGALAKFQEAVKIDPALAASQIGLANAALKLGRNEEAASAAEAALKVDPKNEAALRVRYNACLALGDPRRLASALVGLAAVEPAIARNGLLKLAFDAYDANQNAEAKERFLKVLEVDSSQAQAHYYLALIYVNEGNAAEARTHLERFLALTPNAQEAATAKEMLKQLGAKP
jgi:tetratricopeptide (TPR) repeat protein